MQPQLGAVPAVFTDKIYSIGGELYFNGTKLSSLWSLNGSDVIYNSGSVGVGAAAPNSNAVLDVDAAGNDKGVLLPRLTTAQRTAISGLGASEEGLLVYDESTDSFWYWSGSQWQEMGSAGGDDLGNHTATQALDLNNNNITNGGTVTATASVGDGSGLTGITASGDDLGNHTATQTINLAGNFLSGDTDAEGLFVDASGNIGIGTTLPASHLDVTAHASSDTLVTLRNNGNNAGVVLVASSKTSGVADIVDFQNGSFVVQGNGNVGIGKDNPSAALDVSGEVRILSGSKDIVFSQNNFGNGNTTDLFFNMGDVGYNQSEFALFNQNDNTTSDRYFQLQYSEDAGGLTVRKGGNIGIGTTAPDHKLHVSGTSMALTEGNQNLVLKTSEANNYVQLDVGGSGHSSDAIYIGDVSNTNIYGIMMGDVGIGTASPANKLTVSGDADFTGDVGIGTTSPANKLTVSGDADFTGDVGFGISNPNHRLDVEDSIDGQDQFPSSYVAHIKNTATTKTGGGPDVLLLEVGVDNPEVNTNYIQFVSSGSTFNGRIQGNGAGGVIYITVGSDYAEMLDRLDFAEQIDGGDVVGVFGGKISKRTAGADWVMAISTKAAFVGNKSPEDEGPNSPSEVVAFVGQIPVKVNGAVSKGDYIIASGQEDGMAIAVSPEDLQPEQGRLIVGRAWEDAGGGLNMVNTVVGLPETASTSMALVRRIEKQQDEIAALQAPFIALKSQNDKLASQSSTFEKRFAQIELALRTMNSVELTSTENK